MRLLLISRASSAQAGGMERLSFELITELKKNPSLKIKTLVREGTGRLGAVFFVLRSLPRALALARQADVIHLGDPMLALHGWLIKKILNKPVAVTIHGLDVTYRNSLYQLYLQLFGQFDLALPISEYAKQLMQNSKVKAHNSKVITPGVHDRYFDSMMTRSDLVKLLQRTITYHLSPTTSVLFTAGRLVKRKGHAWFIANVLPKLPENTVYLIAGDGPERGSITQNIKRITGGATGGLPQRAQLAEHGVGVHGGDRTRAPQVVMLGRVSDADLKILYNTVDAFVQPNVSIPGDAEGFGLVLLEAALCQRPVYASRLDGIPGAIHHWKNGTLLPASDAAAWITALQEPLRPQPAARVYTLERFNWPAQAQKYYQALRTIV